MHESRNLPIALDTRSVYRIEIQGRLDSLWITDMCDVTVRHEGDEGQPGVTILTGELEDQAVLMGILNLVYDLGYPLLSLTCLGCAKPASLTSGQAAAHERPWG